MARNTFVCFTKTKRIWKGKPVYNILHKDTRDFLGEILWSEKDSQWTAQFMPNGFWTHDSLRYVANAVLRRNDRKTPPTTTK